MSTFFTIEPVADIGRLTVYRRGDWARREGLARYVVMREEDGIRRQVREFRYKRAAVTWARADEGIKS